MRRALLAVAAVLGLLGAAVEFVSLFFDYFTVDTPFFDLTSRRVFTGLLIAGILVAVLLLIASDTTGVIGGAMLGAIAATFLAGPTYAVSVANSDVFPGDVSDTGYTLDLVGFLLVALGGLLAAVVLLFDGAGRKRTWELDTRRFAPAGLALVGGVVTAYGYGSNFLGLGETFGPRAQAFGSPLIPSPRGLWGQVVAIVAISVLPVVAVLASRRVAIGITAGLLLFVVAEVAYRVTFLTRGPDFASVDAIEGVWVLAIGGFLLAVVLLARLVAVHDPARDPGPGGPPAAPASAAAPTWPS